MPLVRLFILLLIPTPPVFALLLNLSNASEPTTGLGLTHNHLLNASGGARGLTSQIRRNTFGSSGVIATHDFGVNNMIRESDGSLTPEAKTAAKVAACHTIGAGICAGVAAANYAKKEINESSENK